MSTQLVPLQRSRFSTWSVMFETRTRIHHKMFDLLDVHVVVKAAMCLNWISITPPASYICRAAFNRSEERFCQHFSLCIFVLLLHQSLLFRFMAEDAAVGCIFDASSLWNSSRSELPLANSTSSYPILAEAFPEVAHIKHPPPLSKTRSPSYMQQLWLPDFVPALNQSCISRCTAVAQTLQVFQL